MCTVAEIDMVEKIGAGAQSSAGHIFAPCTAAAETNGVLANLAWADKINAGMS